VKVSITYGGSASAHSATDDLRRAGLPIEADALVVSWSMRILNYETTDRG
jgi:hypothetical protein